MPFLSTFRGKYTTWAGVAPLGLSSFRRRCLGNTIERHPGPLAGDLDPVFIPPRKTPLFARRPYPLADLLPLFWGHGLPHPAIPPKFRPFQDHHRPGAEERQDEQPQQQPCLPSLRYPGRPTERRHIPVNVGGGWGVRSGRRWSGHHRALSGRRWGGASSGGGVKLPE